MNGYGLIHVYCGNGKGKTTAAMGLALRCLGQEGCVMILQFLKRDDSGERFVLKKLNNITLWESYPEVKFTFHMTKSEKNVRQIGTPLHFKKP